MITTIILRQILSNEIKIFVLDNVRIFIYKLPDMFMNCRIQGENVFNFNKFQMYQKELMILGIYVCFSFNFDLA